MPDTQQDLIRVSTAGSVDDGKSTLLGRLLLEAGQVYEDHLAALQRDSDHHGLDSINLAHITDGLKAEREQNITIDVAYRYVTTPKRRFIIADTPGHEQYTRNMVTGASTADAALVLVDVQNGVTDQTRRHLFICSILGIPQVALVVNKMDLVDYDSAKFEAVRAAVRAIAGKLRMPPITFIPVSAVKGENVTRKGEAMPWYAGPSVLEFLEGLSPSTWMRPPDLRIPVQLVLRPDRTFRGYAGQIVSGTVRVGEEVMSLPSNQTAKIKSLSVLDGPAEEASTGENVVIELDREVDVSRGHVLVRPRNLPTATQAFEAVVCWMSEEISVPGKTYALRWTTREVTAEIAEVVYRINIETIHRESVPTLARNEIGRVIIETGQPIFLDTYEHNRATGSFILVDPISNDVVAAGMVSRATRADQTSHRAQLSPVIWLTGLSGAGKSTLADAVAERLRLEGIQVARLDGDDLRTGLNSDLGFSPEDRRENLRRSAHVAKLFAKLGNVTLCSFITPTNADRALVREVVGEHHMEVYIKASLETCEARDPKGMYKRARAGEIKQFTGIHAPFEEPDQPDLVIDTQALTIEEAANLLATEIRSRRIALSS